MRTETEIRTIALVTRAWLKNPKTAALPRGLIDDVEVLCDALEWVLGGGSKHTIELMHSIQTIAAREAPKRKR